MSYLALCPTPRWRTFLGLVINKTKGWVVIPQATVPSSMCSLQLMFEESIEFPAKKVFESNLGYAIAEYSPDAIEGTIGATILSRKELKVNDTTTIYGLNRRLNKPQSTTATVKHIEPLPGFPQSLYFQHPLHVEVSHLEERSNSSFGLLVNDAGEIDGLWVPFNSDEDTVYVGMPVARLRPEFEQLQKGSLPQEPKLLDVLLEKVCKNDLVAFGASEGK